MAAGGRDRSITTWSTTNGQLLSTQFNAHDRLITCVKINQAAVFSSSRDRTVKIWDLLNLHLLQVLGNHLHSVWGIDVLDGVLVTSSTDKSLNVWKKAQNQEWTYRRKFNNEDPLRNVMILRAYPDFALSGDQLGKRSY